MMGGFGTGMLAPIIARLLSPSLPVVPNLLGQFMAEFPFVVKDLGVCSKEKIKNPF